MACIRSCVIIGGGIGGLTTARALLQKGVAVTVLEKAKEFIPTAGAGFGFSPNGQACLKHLGVSEQEIDEMGHLFTDQYLMEGNMEKVLARSDGILKLKKRFGFGLLGTLRADLVNVIAKPLIERNILRYSTEVVNVSQTVDNATVHLADGTRLDTDLVIGADGIHSLVLQKIFPDTALEPVFSGENIFYGVIENATGPNAKVKFDHPLLGKQGTLVQGYGRLGETITFPAGNKGTVVWAQTYSGDRAEAEEWGKTSSPQQKLETLMAQQHNGENVMLRELMLNTPASRLLHFPLLYRKQQPLWFKGRVCLLGDSCHATLPYVGQGANQAIEDAIVLAEQLSTEVDLEKALKEYQQIRAPRTKRIVNMAYYLGKVTHGDNPLKRMFLDRFLTYIIESGLFYRVAGEEITQFCPVPIPVTDPSVKL